MTLKSHRSFLRVSAISLLSIVGCSADIIIGNSRSIQSNGYRFDFEGEKATHNDNGNIEAKTTKIVVENHFGDVTITATDQPATWAWELTCWSDSAEVAKSYTQSIKLETTVKDGKHTLKLVLPEPPVDDLRGVQSNLTLSVPATVHVDFENHHGASKVDGITGGTKARCQHGKLELLNLAGALDAGTEHGELSARQIPGGTLSNKHGNVTASHVDGELKVTTSHGDMQLDNVEGNVNATIGFGKLTSTKITGDFHARNEHGQVVVDGVSGQVDIATSFAKLDVKNTGSDAKLRNEHGDITVRNIKGKLDVRTEFGKIDLESSSNEVLCRNEHGKIQIVATNAQLRLIDAETSFADIEIKVPDSIKPTIEAGTKFGKVDAEFPVLQLNSGVDNFKGLDEQAARMTLKNKHGDIRIKKQPPR